MGEGSPLACLTCETEWVGPGPCLGCDGPGLPGRLRDFCPHGKRKPYRGWPCPECRSSFIAIHRPGGRQAQPGWSY